MRIHIYIFNIDVGIRKSNLVKKPGNRINLGFRFSIIRARSFLKPCPYNVYHIEKENTIQSINTHNMFTS